MNRIFARGFAWNDATRKVDLPAEYEARNRQEALNWLKFNKDYVAQGRIVEVDEQGREVSNVRIV